MKNLIIIISVVFCLQSCQQKSETESNENSDSISQKDDSIKSDKQITKLIKEASVNRDSINQFLDKPFDLYGFKKIKGANSTGGRNEEYYLKPDREGMYYRYFLFSGLQGYLGSNKDRIVRKEDGLEITVYKELGKYRHEYIDLTEELIEVRAKFNDLDLPELAFVGLDSNTIVNKLGQPDLVKSQCMVYQHNNKALILNVNNKRVEWLKYVNMKKGIDISHENELFNE